MTTDDLGPLPFAETVRKHGGLSPDRERRALLALIAALLLLKLAVALYLIPMFAHRLPRIYQVGRVDNYYSLAKNIEWGHGYRFTTDTAPTLMREPGYPYFLALLIRYFDNYFDAAVVANVVLSCLAALLVSMLARRVWSAAPAVGLIAAALFLLHPGIFIAESRIGIEILFIFLVLCFLFLMARAVERRRPIDFFIAGLVLGLTCLVRSTPLLFPLPLLAWQLFAVPGPRARLQTCGHYLILAIACLLVLSPWVVRNYRLVHKFIPTASVQGVAMQAGLYKCLNRSSGRSYVQLDDDAAELRNQIATRSGFRFVAGYYQFFFDPRDEVTFSAQLSHAALATYERSPSLMLVCGSENVLNFWFHGNGRIATIAAVVCQLPYLLLAGFGLYLGWRSGSRPALIVLLMFVAYSMAVCLPIQAQARYSVPLIPILAILGSLVFARLFRFRRPMLADRGVPGGTSQ